MNLEYLIGNLIIMTHLNILIVDDDKLSRILILKYLTRWGYNPIEAISGSKALEVITNSHIDLIISDQEMPDMNGLQLLKSIKSAKLAIPFIMLTGHASLEMGIDCIKNGADDYVVKPFNPDDMLARIERTLNYSSLSDENKKLKNHLQDIYSFQNIITKSPAMKEAIKLAEKVTKSPTTTISIYGESGTGKEVLARAIHFAGDNMENNFVAINCAAVPANLLESELFGHVKGAFTGANENRKGKFDLAQGGTILLDEIGDMPLGIQAKLLRVIQERVYERIGSAVQIKVNFRIITATHRDINKMVEEGTFRQDLYHRINPFPITIPPLKDRTEDIPALINYFLEQLRKELGKPLLTLSSAAIQSLIEYKWPGNVRELKNCLERASILAEDELIDNEHLNLNNSSNNPNQTVLNNNNINISIDPTKFSLDYVIKQTMDLALKKCNNNKTQAAEFLKVNRKLFYRRKD